MKNKKMIYVVAALIMSAVAVFNVKTVLEANHDYDLAMASIDALSENGAGENTDGESTGGGDNYTRDGCHAKGGIWDSFIKCVDGGIQDTECQIDGELSVWTFKIFKFSYKKGRKYPVSWERWSCEDKKGECCMPSEQGVRVKR